MLSLVVGGGTSGQFETLECDFDLLWGGKKLGLNYSRTFLTH